MIYLGDNWPAEYRGKLFTLNLHGRRANRRDPRAPRLAATSPGTAGHRSSPPTRGFAGSNSLTGRMAASSSLDWSDTGECHENTGVHRTSGRIYKITHGEPPSPRQATCAKLRCA